jgi:hypothetical protein
LYLNISIIFFLILGISNKTSNQSTSANANLHKIDTVLIDTDKFNLEKHPADSIEINSINDVFDMVEANKNSYTYHIHQEKNIGFFEKLNDFLHYTIENPQYTYQQGLDSLGYKKTFWNIFYYQQIINLSNGVSQIKTDGGKNYFKKLFSFISISLFIFLPVFTLFLMLLYMRHKFTYIEHLIFVFNTQTVLFLLFIVYLLIDFVVDIEDFDWVFLLLFLIYLYKALYNFYKQNHLKTFIKYTILNSFYLFLAFIGITLVAAISLVIN